MTLYTAERHQPRSDSRRLKVRYECEVSRGIVLDQPELFKALNQLKNNSSEIVRYREFGKLGISLVKLEPVLRRILPSQRGGKIQTSTVQGFEHDLNSALEHAQFVDSTIPIDKPGVPLALFGKNKQYLGIELKQDDLRLIGDRAMVEAYIRKQYPDVARGRFEAVNPIDFEPHIRLGEIQYDQISPRDRIALHDDPTGFMLDKAYASMEADHAQFYTGEREDIVFPDQVCLNGLRIFCQPK